MTDYKATINIEIDAKDFKRASGAASSIADFLGERIKEAVEWADRNEYKECSAANITVESVTEDRDRESK